MSTGYSIVGTHVGDFLSVGVSETVTVGNTGLATTMRIYDCNAPLNGYLVTTSNGIFTINEANNSIPTNVGIGTTAPRSTATLQVQGTLLTSNIGTYNTNNANNTLYFNNNSLASISNISTFGHITTSTPGYGDNSCNVATTSYVQGALAQFTGGGGVTGNSSNMPNLTFIGSSNLITTIQGGLIVNSNLTVKGIVAQTNQFGYIALSPSIQISSGCNIYVTTKSSGTAYPMMSTVLDNITTPYSTSGLQFNIDTQTLKSSNIVIDNSIMYNNAFGQITLGSVVQQTNLVPFSNITGLPPGAVPYGTSTNYMSNVVGTSGQVLVSGGSGAPSWTNTITSPSLVTPTLVGNTTCTATFTASNLIVNGTTTIINSTVINTSNISINNSGNCPALSVTQQQNTAQPVAQFMAGSTNAMYINNLGNVGIGTTNPLTVFSVTSNIPSGIGPILSINNRGGGAGASSILEFNTYGTAGTNNTFSACAQIRVIDDGASAAHMAFLTKQSGVNTNPLNERMRVTSTGSVGIGTTNPSENLTVYGSNNGGIGTGIVNSQNGNDSCAVLRLSAGGANTYLFQNSPSRTVDGGNNTATLRNDSGSLRLNASYGGGTGITITESSTGYVGIGTATPAYPLTVYGAANTGNKSYTYLAGNALGLTNGAYPTSAAIPLRTFTGVGPGGWSAYFDKCILALEFNAFSDKRIKTNIKLLNNDEIHTKLLSINPTSYNFIDHIKNSYRATYGFIGQELKEIVPELINLRADYIPNIFKLCSNVEIYKDYSIFTLDTDENILNKKVKFYVYDITDIEKETTINATIIEKIDNKYKVDTVFTSTTIFVYGTEVDDFHNINYEGIIPLLVSGYQYQEKIIQETKTNLANLQESYNTTVQLLMDRISVLEQKQV